MKLEKEFAEAIVSNDLERIGQLVADDWIIIDPNGEMVDRARFSEVVKSGALTHDTMESEDFRVRVYGDSAVVTGVTRTKGKFMGQEFSTQERATDVFVRRRRAVAMRADASHPIQEEINLGGVAVVTASRL